MAVEVILLYGPESLPNPSKPRNKQAQQMTSFRKASSSSSSSSSSPIMLNASPHSQ